MGAELIDGAHPFLIWRIVGPVRDFRYLTESLSRRLDVLTMFFFSHVAKLCIRSQA